jgi:hypothetical protein
MEYEDFLAEQHELEQSVYFHLGILSTQFANIEEAIHDLIVDMSDGDDIYTIHLIEKNTLERNLQLLELLNKYRKYKPDEMTTLISSIRKVKTMRNHLIHGKWDKPLSTGNDVSITVSQSKVEEFKFETLPGQPSGYSHKTSHPYYLSELISAIKEIGKITVALKKLLDPLEKRKPTFYEAWTAPDE